MNKQFLQELEKRLKRTVFGLQSKERTKSIFISLPLKVNWL